METAIQNTPETLNLLLPNGKFKPFDEIEEMVLGWSNPMPDVRVDIFTPGLYTREIFMPYQSLVISRVHRFEHSYTVSMGIANVIHEIDQREEVIFAPHTAITYPGTRRLLTIMSEEGCIWSTHHAFPWIKKEWNDLPPKEKQEKVDYILDRITYKNHNPFII